MANVIDSFRGEHFFLSNFFSCRIPWEGIVYPSTEHAFQASKTLDHETRKWIAAAQSPSASKTMGRSIVLRPDWEQVKDEVMESLLWVKFFDPTLCAKLLETGEAELVEGNTWNDYYWGVCRGRGLNKLGKLLTKVRTEIRRVREEGQ